MIILDAALPSIFIEFPIMLLALIPVIVIEGFVLIKLMGIKKNVFKGSIVANIVSTIAGVPISWGIRLILGLGIAYFISDDNVFLNSVIFGYWPDSPWIQLIVVAIIFVTTYLVSVVLEYWVLKMFFKETKPKELWKHVFIANACTYVLLVIFVFVKLFY